MPAKSDQVTRFEFEGTAFRFFLCDFRFFLYGIRNPWFHYKIGNISDFAGIVLVYLCRRILT
jgi:hypothetical protein